MEEPLNGPWFKPCPAFNVHSQLSYINWRSINFQFKVFHNLVLRCSAAWRNKCGFHCKYQVYDLAFFPPVDLRTIICLTIQTQSCIYSQTYCSSKPFVSTIVRGEQIYYFLKVTGNYDESWCTMMESGATMLCLTTMHCYSKNKCSGLL